MFKALLYSRFKSLYYCTVQTGRKKQNTALAVLLVALMAWAWIVFAGMMGGLFTLFATIQCPPSLYFSLVGAIATLFAVLGSVYYTKTQLYEAKDNEMLLAMPITPGAILGSRLALILFLGYLFEGIVFIPAGIVYLFYYPVGFFGILGYIIGCLIMPAIAIAICCLLAWLIAWLESKLPIKKYITLVFSLLFLAAYIYVTNQLQVIGQAFLGHMDTIGLVIRNYFYPFYAFGLGLGDVQPWFYLLYLGISALSAYLVWKILMRTYFGIITSSKAKKTKKFVTRLTDARSPFKANQKRELLHFLNNPMYMLNGAFGAVLIPVGAIVLAFRIGDIQPFFSYFPHLWGAFATAAISSLTLMNLVSAPSISLEGKTLWIIRSSPVPARTILLSKIMNHFWIVEPFILIGWAIVQFLLPLTAADRIFMLVIPSLANIYVAYMGIVFNLLMPKMDWINETVVIKQGGSVMVTMMVSGLLAALPLSLSAIYIFGMNQGAWVYDLTHLFFFCAAIGLMQLWINKAGVRRFEAL